MTVEKENGSDSENDKRPSPYDQNQCRETRTTREKNTPRRDQERRGREKGIAVQTHSEKYNTFLQGKEHTTTAPAEGDVHDVPSSRQDVWRSRGHGIVSFQGNGFVFLNDVFVSIFRSRPYGERGKGKGRWDERGEDFMRRRLQ